MFSLPRRLLTGIATVGLFAATGCQDAPTSSPVAVAPQTANLYYPNTIDIVPDNPDNTVAAGASVVQVILFATTATDLDQVWTNQTSFAGAYPAIAVWGDRNDDGFLDLTMNFRISEMTFPLGTSTQCLDVHFLPPETGQVSFCGQVTRLADTEAPIVRVWAPEAKDHVDGGAGFWVVWDANDDVGIASQSIAISFDGGTTFTTIATGSEPNVLPYARFVTVPDVKAKDAIIRVTSTDAAGNSGQGLSATFRIKQKGK